MNSSVFGRVSAFRPLFGISMLALSGVALSAPTLVGTTTNASGIDGVVVDSVTYDVNFSTSLFDSTFSTSSGAIDASNALAADLNTLSVTGLSSGGASGFDCTLVNGTCFVWTGSSNLLAGAADRLGGPNPWAGDSFAEGPGLGPGCPQTAFVCLEAAHWTKVTTGVPEPATLVLFGLGLVGIGLSRRRLAR